MILLYHAIVPDSAGPVTWCIGQALPRGSFEKQMRWLSRHGEIISLPEYLSVPREPRRHSRKRRLYALTFDDGMGCTFRQACPILNDLEIPATFFVSTQHLHHGRLLWFSYLNALCFESSYSTVAINGITLALHTTTDRKQARRRLGEMARVSGDPDAFCRGMADKYPLPRELAAEYEGMTVQELDELSRNPLFEVGAHTVGHPFLSQATVREQAREICESKTVLADLARRRVRYFAYPGGDYNRETLAIIRAAGFDAALATIPRRIGRDGRYEIARTGVYSCSLWKLRLKALGVAALLGKIGIAVG